jgi:hypothetical protein
VLAVHDIAYMACQVFIQFDYQLILIHLLLGSLLLVLHGELERDG